MTHTHTHTQYTEASTASWSSPILTYPKPMHMRMYMTKFQDEGDVRGRKRGQIATTGKRHIPVPLLFRLCDCLFAIHTYDTNVSNGKYVFFRIIFL